MAGGAEDQVNDEEGEEEDQEWGEDRGEKGGGILERWTNASSGSGEEESEENHANGTD